MAMKIIDISVTFSESMVHYPSINNFKLNWERHYDDMSDRILFKTSNSNFRLYEKDEFTDKYVYIEKEAAEYLVRKKVKLVGVDYISPDKVKCKDVHMVFFNNDVLIIENLNLVNVKDGRYLLICFPLKIDNLEGCPCRAVLIEE
jgi:arylformamidase